MYAGIAWSSMNPFLGKIIMQNEKFFVKWSSKCCLSFIILSLIAPLSIHAGQKSHLRGQRYCEIIIPKSFRDYAVYNTIGLNDCPEKLWSHITVKRVKEETKAPHVHLNGPRYWVIDGMTNSNLVNPTIKTFGGIKMREAGVLHISLFTLLKSNTFYKPHTIARHTTWVYNAKKPVYELIDPTGKVYVMQSYSEQIHPQTTSSLVKLGKNLQLPKGWQFKTGILKKTEMLKAINNEATVIQDNFLNTYQLATHDFL